MAPKMVPEIIILPEEFILADLRQYFLGGGQVKYRLNLRDGYDDSQVDSMGSADHIKICRKIPLIM